MLALKIAAPLFILILIGYLAVRSGYFPHVAAQGITVFVFNFAVPILLFHKMAHIMLPETIEWRFVGSYFGATLTVYSISMATGYWLFKHPLTVLGIFGMTASYSNMVLLGIPFILLAYGDQAVLPLFLLIAFHSPILIPLTILLIHIGTLTSSLSLTSPRKNNLKNGLKNTQIRPLLLDLLRNPILQGLAAGFAWNYSGYTLPPLLNQTTSMISDAAMPCALFATGASLARFRIATNLMPALWLSSLKLFLHPFLVWCLAVPLFGLDRSWVVVAVMLAALPCGVNPYLFATHYQTAQQVTAATILISTLASIFSLSALLYFFDTLI